MYTYSLQTYGCQMNVGDANWLKKALKGYDIQEYIPAHTKDVSEDITIIYTCSVRDSPEQKVYQSIASLQHTHKHNPNYIIAVGGCVAQQLGEEFFKKFPSVRLIFGTDNNSHVPQAITRILENPSLKISLLDFVDEYQERPAIKSNIDSYSPTELVNIMQGCDNRCTYCIVPFTRGKQKSRSEESILEECHNLVQNGVKEIILIGQNVNAYGQDSGGNSFAHLLRSIAEQTQIYRLSYMTPHPKDFDDDTINVYKEFPNIISSRVHLPVQSGSDNILRKMARHYRRNTYMSLIEKLRKVRPDLTFSTDIIVGFPGETEEDFQQTLDLVKDVGFVLSYSFCYSDRPKTIAQKFENKIDKDCALERLSRLQALQKELSAQHLQNLVGTEVEVLIERPSKKQITTDLNTLWQGKDSFSNTVHLALPHTQNATGLRAHAAIIESKQFSLLGELRGKLW
ncbi:MAG: tRNA (N6-isopentenyl adenosine(37)-C2)-methylthiotransferase MiaB [Desulfovibrionaceae bacterium]